MSFINTIDQLGDKMVFKSIVDGTITEFKDDTLQTVDDYAFYGKKQLTTVELPAVTRISLYAFQNCTALKSIELQRAETLSSSSLKQCTSLERVDLSSATEINGSVFEYDSKLTALIIRTGTMCTLTDSNSFRNTAIASGTGYIYVPKVLIEDYKVAANWSTYATQFRAIEDYPDICG